MPCPEVICSARGSGRAFELTGLVIGMRAKSKYLHLVKSAGCLCCYPRLRDFIQRMNAAPPTTLLAKIEISTARRPGSCQSDDLWRTYHELRFSPLAPVQCRRCEVTRRGEGCCPYRKKVSFPIQRLPEAAPFRLVDNPSWSCPKFLAEKCSPYLASREPLRARLRPARLAGLYSTEVRCQ